MNTFVRNLLFDPSFGETDTGISSQIDSADNTLDENQDGEIDKADKPRDDAELEAKLKEIEELYEESEAQLKEIAQEAEGLGEDESAGVREREVTDILENRRAAAEMLQHIYARQLPEDHPYRERLQELNENLLGDVRDEVSASITGRSERVFDKLTAEQQVQLRDIQGLFGFEIDEDGEFTVADSDNEFARDMAQVSGNIRYLQELYNQLNPDSKIDVDGVIGGDSLKAFTGKDFLDQLGELGIGADKPLSPEAIRDVYAKWYESQLEEVEDGEDVADDGVDDNQTEDDDGDPDDYDWREEGRERRRLEQRRERLERNPERNADEILEIDQKLDELRQGDSEDFVGENVQEDDVENLEEFRDRVDEARHRELPSELSKLHEDMAELSQGKLDEFTGYEAPEDDPDAIDPVGAMTRRKLLQERAQRWQDHRRAGKMEPFQEAALDMLATGRDRKGKELTHDQMDSLVALLDNEANGSANGDNVEHFGVLLGNQWARRLQSAQEGGDENWLNSWENAGRRQDSSIIDVFEANRGVREFNPDENFGLGEDRDYYRLAGNEWIREGSASDDVNGLRFARLNGADEGNKKFQSLADIADGLMERGGNRDMGGYKLAWSDGNLVLQTVRNEEFVYDPDERVFKREED